MKASSAPLKYRNAATPRQGLCPRGYTDNTDNFLPNFCNIRIVFIIVVIAELLAFILALAPQGQSTGRWNDLSLISLFMQWVALTCTTLLCACRRFLSRLNNAGAGIASYSLILLVTAILSEIAYIIGRGTGLEYVLAPDWHSEFLLRNILVSAIVSAVVLRYFYVQYQTRNNSAAESKARFQALQSRIRPHFIFNSLNTIASLTRSRPALAEELIEDLADLFRVNLSDAANLTTLGEELALTRRYLKIEQFRLGERLQLHWELEGLPEDASMPALLIQPLLENAIYHGIEPLAEGGTIHIHGQYQQSLIIITITNPVTRQQPLTRRSSNHMALQNIRERLAIHFGVDGSLTDSTNTPGGQLPAHGCAGDGLFQVKLSFPYHSKNDASPDH